MQARPLLFTGSLLALQLIATAAGLMVERRLLSAHRGFRHHRPMRFRHYMRRRWHEPISLDSSEEADGGGVLPLPPPAADLLMFEPLSDEEAAAGGQSASREADEPFDEPPEGRSGNAPDAVAEGVPCRPCQPGFGQKSNCPSGGFWTSENGLFQPDDNCIMCPPGMYSAAHAHYTKCMPCSKCGDDLYEEYGCTPSSDTKCDLCSTRNVHYTQSYWDKCILMSDYGKTEDEIHNKGRGGSLRKSDVARIDVSTAVPSILQQEMSELRQLAERELTLPENHRLWRWKDDAPPMRLIEAGVKQQAADMQYFSYARLVLRSVTFALAVVAICLLCFYMTRRRARRVVYSPMVRDFTSDERMVISRCASDLLLRSSGKPPSDNAAFSTEDESGATGFENPLAGMHLQHKGDKSNLVRNV